MTEAMYTMFDKLYKKSDTTADDIPGTGNNFNIDHRNRAQRRTDERAARRARKKSK